MMHGSNRLNVSNDVKANVDHVYRHVSGRYLWSIIEFVKHQLTS